MISIVKHIQLFGDKPSYTYDNHEFMQKYPLTNGNGYIGKIENAEHRKGLNTLFEPFGLNINGKKDGQAKTTFQENVTNYYLSLNLEKNLDRYKNTYHVIGFLNDEGKQVYNILYIDDVGVPSFTAPEHASHALSILENNFKDGMLTDTNNNNSIFKNALVVGDEVVYDAKSEKNYIGVNNGLKVYKHNGKAYDEQGNLVESYTNSDGQVVEARDGKYYVGDLTQDLSTTTQSDYSRDDLMSFYWDQIFKPEQEGTLGYKALQNLTSLYEKEAQNAETLAEANLQTQAMAQARNVKSITDTLRNERMAQLRAGMSESQLADRELQMLLHSTDQLTQQAYQTSQDRLAAQFGKTTAREQAFNDYLNVASQLGQSGAGYYATFAGDADAQTKSWDQFLKSQGINKTPEEVRQFISTGQKDKDE